MLRSSTDLLHTRLTTHSQSCANPLPALRLSSPAVVVVAGLNSGAVMEVRGELPGSRLPCYYPQGEGCCGGVALLSALRVADGSASERVPPAAALLFKCRLEV